MLTINIDINGNNVQSIIYTIHTTIMIDRQLKTTLQSQLITYRGICLGYSRNFI